MKNNYYYYEKRSPIKRIIIGALVLAVGAGGYWYYVNYFKTAGTPIPAPVPASESPVSGIRVSRVEGVVTVSDGTNQKQLTAGTTISDHETVTTGADGRIKLEISGNKKYLVSLERSSVLRLSPDPSGAVAYTLELGRLYISYPGDEPAVVNIGSGSVRTELAFTAGTYDISFNDATVNGQATALEGYIAARIWPHGGAALPATATYANAGERITIDFTKTEPRDVLSVSRYERGPTGRDQWYVWARQEESTAVSPADMAAVRDYSLTLTAERKDATVTLTWSAYPGSDFTEYQVLTGQQRAPEYGATPAQRIDDPTKVSAEFSVATDKDANYYYRVCIVRTGSGILCSSPATVRITIEKSVIAAPVISGFITDFGFALSWAPSADATVTDYYLVRSATKQQPVYPADGFIAKFGSGVSQYTDSSVTSATGGVSYYRLCAGAGETVGCSNVLTVRDGVLQP